MNLEEIMSKMKCKKCGETRESSWPGAGMCDKCGFICSECAGGRSKQCPICEKKTLNK